MNNLLARYAECIFWMARYMERAENLARILEVHETHSSDDRGAKDWFAIVRLNGDDARFLRDYPVANAENVIHFYVLDTRNPTSLVSTARYARENARILRPWISTEMWTQINVFYNRMIELTPRDIALPNLSNLCGSIKQACQTHTGITDGTFFRDEGWYFYLLGRQIERADQTTRLLDIGYHQLVRPEEEAHSHHDFVRWHAILRSVAGYHAFRRVYPRGMTPATVAGFIMLNESFPRSVVLCVREMNALLTRLKAQYKLRGGNAAMDVVDRIMTSLTSQSVEAMIQGGLHEYLDWIQARLNEVTAEFGQSFFGYASQEGEQQQEA